MLMLRDATRTPSKTSRAPLPVGLRGRKILIEPLEQRALLAADLRTYDGSGNNVANPEWGSTNEQLLRRAAAEYFDGMATPIGAETRASARAVSNAVVAQVTEELNDRDLAAFIYAWGQFLDHDMDLTDTGTTETFPVLVPQGDDWFDPDETGTKTISLRRSVYDLLTGDSTSNPRQQVNSITAFIDGSQIYGSTEARALALRTLVGGQLKTSEGGLLPYNTMGLENGNPPILPNEEYYVAGDIRANENIELTSLHSLFVREHNRQASRIARANPNWTDEQVFQAARRIVIGELQAITYNEFLPALLGPNALPRYQGYNPAVNPGIANEFSTAAFRLGHSLLGADVEFLDNQGEETHEEVALRDAFNNPEILSETGIDGILKYLATDRAQELDNQIVDDVRNFLFGPPGAGGFDLASLNIQRGRDHGLADYNAVRVAYGLRAVTSFSQITSNVDVQQALEEVYGNVNNIDLWVGGLAEDHVGGGSLGQLFRRIVVDQFTRLRDGDRFWYERDLDRTTLSAVRNTSLSDVIRRNTTISNLQENVFFFRASVSGLVFFDANANGSLDRRESPLPGITVQLLDAEGNVLATTRTGRDGRYRFDQLDLGTQSVRIVLPRGTRQTTADLPDFTITRDMSVNLPRLGIAPNSANWA